jgi:hypothetical protein
MANRESPLRFATSEKRFARNVMNKKYIILGLALLVTGGAALGWTLTERKKEQKRADYYRSKYGSEPNQYLTQYNEWLQLPPQQRANLPWWLDKYGKTKTEDQLQQEQQERLKADLEKLAAGQKEVPTFADILYGKNWQSELSKYKKQKQLQDYMFTGSISCVCTGGVIFTWSLLFCMWRTMIRASAALKKSFASSKCQESNKNKEQTKDNPKAREKILHQAKAVAKVQAPAKEKTWVKAQTNEKVIAKADTVGQRTAAGRQKKPQGLKERKRPKLFIASGWKSSKKNSDAEAQLQTVSAAKSGHETVNKDKNPESTAELLSDKKHLEPRSPSGLSTRTPYGAVNSSEATLENENPNIEFEDSLKAQVENMEKQMAEFKNMAQGVRKTSLEHSQPLSSTLSELSQQMSAIREYAASQQKRLTKLQDGYDWNITRTFCLRVIRCIDNLENRISKMTEQNMEVGDLEEIKDELLFALESSGVEQFEPEINSDYRGQEKFAEAVKEKESCDDSKKAGKVAKVIKPGYQYFIDEENIKIVRPAQIKLFG